MYGQSWATEAMKRLTLHRFISLPALNASSLPCFNFLPYLTFHRFIASQICLQCLSALTKKYLRAEAMKR
jgi:hypothetical protein